MAQPEVARAIVDLDGSLAGNELKKLQERAKELRGELVKLGKDNDLGGFRQKEKELKLVNSQMKNVQKSAGDIEQVMKKLNGASLNELTRTQRHLNAEIKASTRHTQEEIAAYNQKVSKLKQVNAEISKVRAESQLTMKTQQSWLSGAAQGFNKYFAILSAGIATITGVVFSVKALINGNMELDDSMSDVMKTTGLTKNEVRELYSEFKNFNTRTPRKELLALAEEAGRLGMNSKRDIMGFVEVANQIKIALGDELGGNAEEAIREVGKLTNVYKVGEKYGVDFRQSMLMVGSALNQVAASGQSEASYLIDLTKRLAGVGSQAGIAVQDVIGFAAALDEMGQTSEVSSTTLNKVIVSMFKDVKTYAGLAEMSVDEFTSLLNTDANEALLQVLKGLNGNNAGLAIMAEKLDGLGLDGARSVQVLAALAGNIDLVRKYQDISNESLEKGTSLTEEYNVKNNNMAGNMEKLGRALKSTFINSGMNEALEGIVSKMAKWIEIPVSQTMEDQRIKVNALVIELTNANTQEERKKKVWEELHEMAPDVLKDINQENINIVTLTGNLAKYNEETIRKIALQRAGEELAKVQEKLGKVQGDRAIREADLMEKFVLLQKRAAGWDKERAQKIQEIYASDNDILEKERQIDHVVDAINQKQGYAAVQAGETTFNIVKDIVSLRERENELLAKSNLELSKYQDMYKSIMGVSPDQGKGDWFNFGPGEGSSSGKIKKPVDPDATKSPGSSGDSSPLNTMLEFRMRMINESKSLIEQEDIAYQERLNNAGIFGREKEKLTEEELQVMEILEVQHLENIKKINDRAFSDDIIEQQKNFDQETIRRQTAHNNEIIALGSDKEAIADLKRKFEQEEIQRQSDFLSSLLMELQATLDGEGLFSLDEKLLSEEQKEILKLRIAEIMLKLSELGIAYSGLMSAKAGEGEEASQTGFQKFAGEGGNVDIFGMTAESWEALLQNLADGKIFLDDITAAIGSIGEAWSMVNDIRTNQEATAMQNYQASIETRKQLLQKQLEHGKISQENYNQQIATLDETLDEKKKELAYKQARREKSIALVNAIVNTASGIVKMLATVTWPLNLIMAALVGVMGGLQIAKIASTPLPQYDRGRYDVIGARDGKKYRAGVMDSPGTGLVSSPTILVGEKPEIIIDPYTTRNLQINYPDVIKAINHARVPQYASGYYPSSTTRENSTIYKETIPPELSNILKKLSSQLEHGIDAKLIADGEYIRKHRQVNDDYQELMDQVNLKS